MIQHSSNRCNDIKEEVLARNPMRHAVTGVMGLMIGKLVKKCREAAGLTQEELSTAIGAHSRQFISWIEGGNSKTTPMTSTLCLIAAACGVEISDLLPPCKDVLKKAKVTLGAKKVRVLEQVK